MAKFRKFMKADPQKGYNFGFYMVVNCEDKNKELQAIGETNNGRVNGSKLMARINTAKALSTSAKNSGILGLELQQELKNSVLIIPCFTRPKADTLGGNIYTHNLSKEALECEDFGLKRIDEQYINMISAAKEYLQGKGYTVSDKLIMTGFSAAGKFARRIKFLHPEHVQAVITGGLDFPPIPKEQLQGKKLNYPLGIADYSQLTGRAYNEEEQNKIPEYMYIGGDDENDFTKFDECVTKEEREILEEIYGKGTVQEKWESVRKSVQARSNYHLTKIPGVKHTPAGIIERVRSELKTIVSADNIQSRQSQEDKAALETNEPAGFVEKISIKELQQQSIEKEPEQQKIVPPNKQKSLNKQQENMLENIDEKTLN